MRAGKASWRSRKLSWSRRVGRIQVGTGEERSNLMEETPGQGLSFQVNAQSTREEKKESGASCEG